MIPSYTSLAWQADTQNKLMSVLLSQLFPKVLAGHPSSVLIQISGIWFPDCAQPPFPVTTEPSMISFAYSNYICGVCVGQQLRRGGAEAGGVAGGGGPGS